MNEKSRTKLGYKRKKINCLTKVDLENWLDIKKDELVKSIKHTPKKDQNKTPVNSFPLMMTNRMN